MIRRPRLRSTVTTLAAAAVIVGGADLASYAATGNAFILGHANAAGGTTALKNTGRGPALSLNSIKSAPPLVVNSSKLVKHLNANMVGGKTASQLGPTNLTYKIGHAGSTLSPSEHFLAVKSPPAGTYAVSVKGLFETGSSTNTILCTVLDRRVFSSMNLSLIYLYGEAPAPVGGIMTVDNSGFATFSGHHTLITGCETTGNTGTDTIIQPLTFTFTKVTQKVKHAPGTTIPKHAAAKVGLR